MCPDTDPLLPDFSSCQNLQFLNYLSHDDITYDNLTYQDNVSFSTVQFQENFRCIGVEDTIYNYAYINFSFLVFHILPNSSLYF